MSIFMEFILPMTCGTVIAGVWIIIGLLSKIAHRLTNIDRNLLSAKTDIQNIENRTLIWDYYGTPKQRANGENV